MITSVMNLITLILSLVMIYLIVELFDV